MSNPVCLTLWKGEVRMQIQTDTGMTLYEDKGKDWVVHLPKQRINGIIRKPPEAGREAWNRLSPMAFKRSQSCPGLYFGLLASRTMKQMYLSHQFVALWHGSLEK